MSWFLKHKKKSLPRKRSNSASARKQPWDPQVTLARLKVIGIIAAVVLGSYGWYRAERGLSRYTAEHFAVKTTPAQVEIVDAPAWMSRGLRDQLSAAVAHQLSENPLDQRSVQAAYRAVADNPWVSQLHDVRRLPDGRVQLHAEYRQPIALVQGRDGYHIVDAAGIRLVGPYDHDQIESLGLPIITGVRNDAPAPGHAWGGDDITAGLSLVMLLSGETVSEQIVAYDVSSRGPGGRLNLLLQTRGKPILWGMPPGEAQPIEAADAVKIQHLRNPYAIRSAVEGKTVLINSDVIRVLQPSDGDAARAVGYHFQQ